MGLTVRSWQRCPQSPLRVATLDCCNRTCHVLLAAAAAAAIAPSLVAILLCAKLLYSWRVTNHKYSHRVLCCRTFQLVAAAAIAVAATAVAATAVVAVAEQRHCKVNAGRTAYESKRKRIAPYHCSGRQYVSKMRQFIGLIERADV
jgi:hypothetical protein